MLSGVSPLRDENKRARPVESGAYSGPRSFRHHVEHGFTIVQRLRKLSMKFLQPNGHFLWGNGRPDPSYSLEMNSISARALGISTPPNG
jgi:hypothetical protein